MTIMKKILLILWMALVTLSVQGQPGSQQRGKGDRQRTERRDGKSREHHAPVRPPRSRPGEAKRPGPGLGGQHQGKPQPGQMMPPGRGNRQVEEPKVPKRKRHEEHYDIPMRDYREDMGRGQRRRDHWTKTYCVKDWQELWNGCHVRIHQGRVSVLTLTGERVVRGDEVVLLPSGYYLLRNMDNWQVYDPLGSAKTIFGEEIIAWPNGLFCVRHGEFWTVYDSDGDRVGNAWGDRVELLDNGLICCERSGMYFYYDRQGNERR